MAPLPRLRPLARVAGYAGAVALVLGAGAARAGYQRVVDGQLHVGSELERVQAQFAGAKTIFMNGAAIHLAMSVTDEDPAAVVDRFEGVCETRPDASGAAMGDIAGVLRTPRPATLPAFKVRQGVLRAERKDGSAASVACLSGDRPFDAGDVAARFEAFVDSGDLSEFGHYRYVYAHREHGHTSVHTAWTDGPVNLKRMLPAEGDADGFDSPVVPRPPGSRRLVSIASGEVPYTVHVYESPAPEAAVRAHYDRELPDRGWKRYADDGKGTVVYGRTGGALIYTTLSAKDGRTDAVVTSSGREDSLAIVNVGAKP